MSSTAPAQLAMRAAVLCVLFLPTAFTSPLGELETQNNTPSPLEASSVENSENISIATVNNHTPSPLEASSVENDENISMATVNNLTSSTLEETGDENSVNISIATPNNQTPSPLEASGVENYENISIATVNNQTSSPLEASGVENDENISIATPNNQTPSPLEALSVENSVNISIATPNNHTLSPLEASSVDNSENISIATPNNQTSSPLEASSVENYENISTTINNTPSPLEASSVENSENISIATVDNLTSSPLEASSVENSENISIATPNNHTPSPLEASGVENDENISIATPNNQTPSPLEVLSVENYENISMATVHNQTPSPLEASGVENSVNISIATVNNLTSSPLEASSVENYENISIATVNNNTPSPLEASGVDNSENISIATVHNQTSPPLEASGVDNSENISIATADKLTSSPMEASSVENPENISIFQDKVKSNLTNSDHTNHTDSDHHKTSGVQHFTNERHNINITRSPTQKVNDTHSEGLREFESVHFTDDDFHRCFKDTGKLDPAVGFYRKRYPNCTLANPGQSVYREVFAGQGEMSASFTKSWSALDWLRLVQSADRHHCVIKLRVPRGQAVALFMEETTSDSEEFNIIADDSVTSVLVNSAPWGAGDEERHSHTSRLTRRDHQLVHSATDHVFLLVCLVTGKVQFGAEMSFTLRFKAVAPRTRFPAVHYETPSKGFVQTPFFDGFTNHLTHFQLPLTTVIVPPDHVVMVSFPWGELTGVIILETDTSKTRFRCREEYPNTTVLTTASLAVTFNSFCRPYSDDPPEESFGFRMNFSFHHVTAMPERLSDGTWNCSVPHWPDFRQHLLCNFQRECSGGEDEVPCPYYTPRCGAGFITSGRACLFYRGKLGRRISWFDASDLCVERGGRLATLKTEEDLKTAQSLFPVSRFKIFSFFIGIFRATGVLGLGYRNSLQWTDGTIVHNGAWAPGSPRLANHTTFPFVNIGQPSHCGYYNQGQGTRFAGCGVFLRAAAAICEKVTSENVSDKGINALSLPLLGNVTFNISAVTCPKGHVTHEFLACDVHSECWSRDEGTPCAAPLSPLPPPYTCRNLIGQVPYTLVCDHRPDCSDNSDEDFCIFPPCPSASFYCGNSECIPRRQVCDGSEDCYSASRVDEQDCSDTQLTLWSLPFVHPSPPAILHTSTRTGLITAGFMPRGADGGKVCPQTHVRCLDNGNCLPLYLRCNGVFDCLHHEDEAACDVITCPGYYRCRGSAVCLHPSSVCDGYPQCPLHDDELLCDLSCPPNCVCRGLAFYCGQRFAVEEYGGLRYLDAADSGLTPSDVKGSPLLIFLSLAECGLSSLDGLALPNLLDLDLSHNNLTSLDTLMLDGVPQVRKVVLSGNVFLRVLDSGQGRHDRLSELDLSGVYTPQLNATVLTAFPELQHLNLSGSQVERVLDDGFQRLTELRVVDLRGCPVSHIAPVMFQGLRSLQAVYADSFRLCCPALLPADFNVHDCHAPFEEVSSCDDLLGSEAYSAVTFVIALVAVIGNGSSFVFRAFVSKSRSKLGFGVFVTHLSLSDFLMGVYLIFLGVADRAYKDRYLWNDLWWRNSSACKVAGFLSLLSSEVSTFIMCLITLDRFLVLRFPFSRVHFGLKSAHLASCLAWLAGVILATVPLLPVTSHWRFYGHTSICVPLPVTRKEFAGRWYSFSIVIVLNFVLFIFVCCGQLVIYWSVQANAMSAAATSTTRRTQDLTIARRLVAVAMSDFLCWFPIGLLGLLASRGVPIPGEVNVVLAVLVLPLNSALNPFLYTVNVLLERRRLAREERLRKMILSQLSAKS